MKMLNQVKITFAGRSVNEGFARAALAAPVGAMPRTTHNPRPSIGRPSIRMLRLQTCQEWPRSTRWKLARSRPAVDARQGPQYCPIWKTVASSSSPLTNQWAIRSVLAFIGGVI